MWCLFMTRDLAVALASAREPRVTAGCRYRDQAAPMRGGRRLDFDIAQRELSTAAPA
jgi:hypothetical protein